MNATPQFRSLTVVCFALALLITHASSAEETIPPKPARKPIELPGIVIDLDKGHVDLEATIRVTDGPLELVACTKDTKEHESIVAVTARPMHIHTALLLAGATNGHPAMRKAIDEENTRWLNLPPRGDRVDVFLVIKDDAAKAIEHPISDFVLHSKQRIDEVDGDVLVAPEQQGESEERTAVRFPHTFLFTGSHLIDNGEGARRYLADESGDVISIATFGDEVLSLPYRETQANNALMWRANPKALPKAGTQVTLRLRPQPKVESSPNDNSTIEKSSNLEK